VRVLYYNWADYTDREKRGGGVSVYQRNLIDGFAARDGIETAFLSSGLAHGLSGGAPKVIRLQGGDSPRYTLVNSGLIAPSHANFAGVEQIDHAPTEKAFADFVDRTGPWDVIHFNTLEGLPANVLALRARWPQTRFVLSLHNYYPICPQVNLWHAERETCPGFDAGARCTGCLPAVPDARAIRLGYAVGWTLSRVGMGPGTFVYDRMFRPGLGLAWRVFRLMVRLTRRKQIERPQDPTHPALARVGTAQHFANRRARMVSLINDNCDAVLCVSGRVKQIADAHGLNPDLTETLLIGTRAAEAWHNTCPRDAFLHPDGTLRLAYLGYMRRDKGYHFLMRALAALPPETAGRLHLTLAAGRGDPEAMALLDPVRERLASVRHVNGYTHDELDGILDNVDLGVVPVMWEDNLPQVAIEMHARHIPLLCANRGGARELGGCDALVHRAGDAEDFARVLGTVLSGRVTPDDYWASAMAPVEMGTHIDRLMAVYRRLA
jgi:glycosyltransferase involved in cell wall biosynthesis